MFMYIYTCVIIMHLIVTYVAIPMLLVVSSGFNLKVKLNTSISMQNSYATHTPNSWMDSHDVLFPAIFHLKNVRSSHINYVIRKTLLNFMS